jgi:hypothetical protein
LTSIAVLFCPRLFAILYLYLYCPNSMHDNIKLTPD